MINVSPIGRNASTAERNEFERFDKEAGVRKEMVEKLRERFGHLGLTYVFSPASFSCHPGWCSVRCAWPFFLFLATLDFHLLFLATR